MKQGADILRSIEGDPPDADTLGARGKPEVLDRQARAVQVGVADRVTAQNFASATVAIAADADAQGGFPDAFDLQVEVLASSLVEKLRLDQPLPSGDRLHRRLRLLAPDEDETPGLHEANRRRLVGGFEQPAYELVRNRVRTEAPDVSALGDHAHDSREVVVIEAPTCWIVAAFSGTRVIEACW